MGNFTTHDTAVQLKLPMQDVFTKFSPVFSPKFTYAVHIIWCMFNLAMSGKLPLAVPQATMNIQVMPYGLSCTLSVFQCLINNLLRDMLGNFVIAYMTY